MWDLSLIVDGLSRPDERRAVKIIKLCPDISINVLMVQNFRGQLRVNDNYLQELHSGVD